MSHTEYYKAVGKLLYAIANADGMIKEKDLSPVRTVIYEELVPAERGTDEIGANEAWYAEYEFENMLQNAVDAEIAFTDFVNFSRDHHLNKLEKEQCMRAATKVAQTMNSRTNFERFYLKKLRHALYNHKAEKEKPVEEFAE